MGAGNVGSSPCLSALVVPGSLAQKLLAFGRSRVVFTTPPSTTQSPYAATRASRGWPMRICTSAAMQTLALHKCSYANHAQITSRIHGKYGPMAPPRRLHCWRCNSNRRLSPLQGTPGNHCVAICRLLKTRKWNGFATTVPARAYRYSVLWCLAKEAPS